MQMHLLYRIQACVRAFLLLLFFINNWISSYLYFRLSAAVLARLSEARFKAADKMTIITTLEKMGSSLKHWWEARKSALLLAQKSLAAHPALTYLAVLHAGQVLDCSRYSHSNIEFLEENKRDTLSVSATVLVSSHKPCSGSITYSSFYMTVVVYIKRSSWLVPFPTLGCSCKRRIPKERLAKTD